MKIVLNINNRPLTTQEALKILEKYGEYELKVFDPEINDIGILDDHMMICDIVCYASKYKKLINEYNTKNIIKIELETLL